MPDNSNAQFGINLDLELFTNVNDTVSKDDVANAMGIKPEDVGDEVLSTLKMKLADDSDPIVKKSLALIMKAAEKFELPVGTLKADTKDGHLMLRFISQVGAAIPEELQ
eukprot:CAMPEP_0176372002 /NCGR_PEP_ID=MMETSP0126-20121128/25090_1 /TAXON_ID=141414 ORGANISM="Strombidinopsis acuminatum, Strain SPMC142" /NCGR_SAMPLE_ID=MMETSP0126 /ASSEMBLY_ACC=CAM_ASM_000229 /LENGTH=108 /DNA_ID=CAMNT_0017731679 /DNA_START=734 /DNA_END=1060 /DNA_ORIENTATION=-